VMQRINQQDLSGYVLEQGGWTHLKLEAEAEQKTTITFPRSGRTIVREEGDLLWTKREGPDEIAEHKKRGSYYFASQFQQRPVPLGGGIIKRAWWKRYPVDPISLKPLTPFVHIMQSWDTAAKTNNWNDYSVCTTWGVTAAGQFYLLHRWRQRAEYPDLKRAMRDLAARWKPASILIEDTSAGQSVVQDLKRETALPIIPVKVHHDKMANTVAASGVIEAGNVLLPDQAEWDVEEYITLMSYFPNDAYHDDDVDSTTIFINYMREHGFVIQDYWRRETERLEGTAVKKCANPHCNNPLPKNGPIYGSRGMEYCSLVCSM
jgi:predicted phage terminase large subunit-like protein